MRGLRGRGNFLSPEPKLIHPIRKFLNGIFETEAGETEVQQEPVGQQGAAPLPPEEISLEEFWKVVDAATNPAEAPQLAEPTTQTQGERTVSGYGQGERHCYRFDSSMSVSQSQIDVVLA